MKLFPVAAMALFSAAPAFAGAPFLVDFEQSWPSGTTVDNTYAAAGVSFSNVLGLSNNDGLGNLPNGDYYANAPSPLGVAFAQLDGVVNTAAYMNVASGADNALTFFYSSPGAITGALKAYSGLNGTGTLLGSFDLAATDADYSAWKSATFLFNGTARSFDLTASANAAAFDNISAVPEPESFAMLLAGLGVLGFMARRNKKPAA